MTTPTIIVHGGAWDWDDALDADMHEALRQAAITGYTQLQNGAHALDAVEATVRQLEDCPLFEAGIGSHPNQDGVIELDALLIDGATRNFGAVGAVKRVQHPITLARYVMEHTPHSFMVGDGADRIAQDAGIDWLPNLQLFAEHVLDKARGKLPAPAHDTVGAVAIDANGNIAVGTSTGGTSYKLPGRVGDSPIFGAGGYADNAVGGAGATGKGEHSMRTLLSKYVVDQIAAGKDAQQAATDAVAYVDSQFEESMIGVISVDAQGNIGAAHSTPKLAIGWVDADGDAHASTRGGIQTID